MRRLFDCLYSERFWVCSRVRRVLAGCLFLFLCFQVAEAAHDEVEENGESVKVRLRSTLWETLIENGVNPTLWKDVFYYNRRHNKAFARIKSAHRIPNGITIYIPSDWQSEKAASARRAVPKKAVVQDTVFRLGMPVMLVKAGRNQWLNDVIKQFCFNITAQFQTL